MVSPEEVQKYKDNRFVNMERTCVETTNSPLRKLPAHLVQCYLTLKHMGIRQNKNRLLKILNFYRSVQKRVVLELKEFSRREVLNNDVKVKPPEEAFYVGDKASSVTENFQNMGLDKDKEGCECGDPIRKKRDEDDDNLDEDEDIATLVDIKRWKYNGQYVNRFLDTCPQPLTISCRNDRPFEHADYVSGHGLLRQTKRHISEQSKAYLNRVDQYKICESTQEIDVVDDFGINVMYDASIMDMITFEQELTQIATHFIKKTELDFDFERFEYSLVDRVEVLSDLMEWEKEYQFVKAQVVMAYLDALEHSCDILA